AVTVARDRLISASLWLAVHFDGALDEVDDPVIGNARLGIDAWLELAVLFQTGVRDFDDQERCLRMLVVVIAQQNDGYIRLGFGVVAQRQWKLRANLGPAEQTRHQ